MTDRIQENELSIVRELHEFVTTELLPGTGVAADEFWRGASALIHDLAPRNRRLLARRDELQSQIDAYHLAQPGQPDPKEYRAFLTRIGYLEPDPADFTITTTGVDSEIANQAGPQLVVPLLNARFAVNAANARWGSLYDALYGTDAISPEGELKPGSDYNPARGAAVIARGREFLDNAVPLSSGSHTGAVAYVIGGKGLEVTLVGGEVVELAQPDQLVGYTGSPGEPRSILLKNHGLHIEIEVDRGHPIGATDAAGIKDIVLEAALTSIMDLEDSVAAVDAQDKTLGYRNWLGLMKGTLTEEVSKGGTTFTRTMNSDREFTSVSGEPITLHGRALMLIRHVGHLMMTDVVLDRDGNQVGEGMLDAIFTALGAMHDLNGSARLDNSRTSSIYVVKPKMHGPEEALFTVELFERVEALLGLPPLTMKLGVMDEERRTTVNLKASIAAAKDRIFFINTGFLDRTGDEIHTSLYAGPIVRKAELRTQSFLTAYEDHNVDVGLAAGLPHRAQIGKGMWAMPDLMAAMLEQKIAHPKAGATTAWVPSPTAATLHATHYHQVDAFAAQLDIVQRPKVGIEPILLLPLESNPTWSKSEKRAELDDNIQSILGYVVRWVDQGIGCSKVPNLSGVALMEDRATLRISSQLMANWLAHGVITETDVLDSLSRIAPLVDAQNAHDQFYEALIGADGQPGLAFQAARDLVLLGAQQPNGYTEVILHRARRLKKAQLAAL